MAKRNPPLWETLFIKLSELPQFNNKLDGEFLNRIRNNSTYHLERAKTFLNVIKTWPEMTLEIVAQGMDDIDDNETANKVRGYIVSVKSQQTVQTCSHNNEAGTDGQISDLLLAYDTNMAEQQQA